MAATTYGWAALLMGLSGILFVVGLLVALLGDEGGMSTGVTMVGVAVVGFLGSAAGGVLAEIGLNVADEIDRRKKEESR